MLFAFGLTVTIGPSGFPPQVSIQDGDSVTRKNDDTVNRQVVADDGSASRRCSRPARAITSTVTIKGQISQHGATGEHVTIQPQPRGTSTWTDVAEVATKNQFFVATVEPRASSTVPLPGPGRAG
jgi:hypothetical protein